MDFEFAIDDDVLPKLEKALKKRDILYNQYKRLEKATSFSTENTIITIDNGTRIDSNSIDFEKFKEQVLQNMEKHLYESKIEIITLCRKI